MTLGPGVVSVTELGPAGLAVGVGVTGKTRNNLYK